MRRLVLLSILVIASTHALAQKSEFIISGRFKIDGSSMSDSKIIVEKNGRQVKSLDGSSKFEIALEFQSIYVISFVKEGFVTKRLRFDTNVPVDRIEYGFEPFGFSVELFEQYDDVNMVVFNQPVGKISYSELIDEFDYDTDYTKSIQTQIDKAMDDVEVAKEKKIEKDAANASEIANLTSSAEKSAKSGDYTTAITNLEKAVALKKDPLIEKRIQDLKQEAAKQEKQKEFNGVLAQADALMAKGDLEGAKKLYDQANGIMGGDPKVKEQLAKIQQEESRQAQANAAFDQTEKEAQTAMAANNFDLAIAKAEAALALKKNPEAEKILAQAKSSKDAADQKAAAEAAKLAQSQKLIADGDKAFEKGDFDAAEKLYAEAKSISPEASIDEKLKKVTAAKAELAEEQKKQEQAKAQLNELIGAAQKALANADVAGAKEKLAQASALGSDERIGQLQKEIAAEEDKIAKAKAQELENKAAIDQLLSSADKALDAGDFAAAEELFNQSASKGADQKRVSDGLAKVQAGRDALAKAEAEQAVQRQREEEAAAKAEAEAKAAEQAAKEAAEKAKEDAKVTAEAEKSAADQAEKEAAAKAALEAELAEKAAKEAEQKAKLESEAAAKEAAEKAQAEADEKKRLEEEAAKASAMSEQQKETAKKEAQAEKEAQELAEKEAAEKAKAAEAERLKQEQDAEKLAKEEAARVKENSKNLESAEQLAQAEAEAKAKLEAQKLEQEAEAKAALETKLAAEKSAEEEAQKQKLLEAQNYKSQADDYLKKNQLDQALAAYNEALKLIPGDQESTSKIQQIADLKNKMAAEKEKAKEAAVALTEQGGRESEQLAQIIQEEEQKAGTKEIAAPTHAKVPNERPGAPSGPITISDPKVGKEALQTKTAQLTEDEKYDGQLERTEAQQQEFYEDQEQKRLKEKYTTRKTVETEKAGNSLITWIYMNTGNFVKTYKKVEHNWGGVYFFIDGQATNQRFWEHETQ